MSLPNVTTDRVLNIYLTLVQYPILRTRIRARMRRELFERGVISMITFEEHVREEAIRSQTREGMRDPFTQEPRDVWETRLNRIRNHLTDFYFANNLPYYLFEQIIREAIHEQSNTPDDIIVSFNPELAPQDMLFEQGFAIELMPSEKREHFKARLQEIKVVLIRTMISDHLAYIKIAKEWFRMEDLFNIRQRKIGGGKIGGKAAGMLLANRILETVSDEELNNTLKKPISYYLAADVTYDFMAANNLTHWNDQKYKSESEIRAEYPQIQTEFVGAQFPEDLNEKFRQILEDIGHEPIIVRSSSLLEDNLGLSFAGKYESIFCPNQGLPAENLKDLTQGIQRVYASIFNPDALLYRRGMGVQDYDERMAILIQVVEGERFRHYYMPHAAGVGFSRNLYRWAPQIRREDGFLRLVWGLGTRAVEQTGNDYPRLVALSHPLLRPENSPKDINRYSQHFVDAIDLRTNQFKTLPIHEVLHPNYPVLRYICQLDMENYLSPIRSKIIDGDTDQLVITFEELLRRTPFAERMRKILKLLESYYQVPVDTEFTVSLTDLNSAHPGIRISVLQCRPQSHFQGDQVSLPVELPESDIIFSTRRMVPRGHIGNIRYVLFVTPEGYYSLPTATARAGLSQAIGHLNAALADETFICVGPGRWGSNNPDLGVRIGYSDVYNTSALVELTGEGVGAAPPEPSFGTHFFQDLMEAKIYPLAIYLNDSDVAFRHDFFYDTPNQMKIFYPGGGLLGDCLRLIRVCTYRHGHHLELVMDDDQSRAVAFLAKD
jgi:hypothetical protein